MVWLQLKVRKYLSSFSLPLQIKFQHGGRERRRGRGGGGTEGQSSGGHHPPLSAESVPELHRLLQEPLHNLY